MLLRSDHCTLKTSAFIVQALLIAGWFEQDGKSAFGAGVSPSIQADAQAYARRAKEDPDSSGLMGLSSHVTCDDSVCQVIVHLNMLGTLSPMPNCLL